MSMVSRTFFEKALGYLWRRYAPAKAALPDAGEEDLGLIHEVRNFTMTSPERLVGLMNAVRYVVAHKVPGDIVECGVWKGGSMMAVAKTLLSLKVTDRDLYLFDTFAGMTAPTEKDGTIFGGKAPSESYDEARANDGSCRWNYSPLRRNSPQHVERGLPGKPRSFRQRTG